MLCGHHGVRIPCRVGYHAVRDGVQDDEASALLEEVRAEIEKLCGIDTGECTRTRTHARTYARPRDSIAALLRLHNAGGCSQVNVQHTTTWACNNHNNLQHSRFSMQHALSNTPHCTAGDYAIPIKVVPTRNGQPMMYTQSDRTTARGATQVLR